MFKKDSPNKQRDYSSADVTYIAADCQITGNLTVKGDLRIDGHVEGSILATGTVIIGESAKIQANIEGNTIILAGEVHGNTKSYDLLELAATARLFGDICSRQLKIDQGAIFVGTSKLTQDDKTDVAIPDKITEHDENGLDKNQDHPKKHRR